MKTLHLYLLRQCLATLCMTVMVFTFVLIAGNLLKEVLGLLVSGQVSLFLVIKSLLLLIPWVMAFALPISMLMSGLMVFGRFSADQEYTAARSAGISLLSLVTPVLALALLMTGVCAWFNLQISPSSRVAYKQIFADQLNNLATFIPEGRYIDFTDEFVLYVSKTRGNNLFNIRFYQFAKGHKMLDVFAKSGRLIHEEGSNTLRLVLNEARVLTRISGAEDILEEVESADKKPDSGEKAASFENEWLPLYLEEYETEDIPLNIRTRRTADISDMTLPQMLAGLKEAREKGMDIRPYIKEIHHQTAFSFACISFILVAIPLSLKTQRRETNISLAMALIVLLVYYSFFILGDALVETSDPALHLWLLYWIPNFLFQGTGLFLLWKANRGIG
ncbi:MAG: LptF/LptG family permease [Verrucomicrobia bacterium]|nr:LptF/LptG family permease [Verrucomicrobiota bacterium]